ncbi:kinase-like domain-containing protein [Mycena filopes]|nr:kinase-like domain-containing protein [Mycena filopes]
MTIGLAIHLKQPLFRQQFLASRGDQAQRLLNLTQDLLDLDCPLPIRPLICKTLVKLSQASGLHPHCFALTGLQKIGRQVAAGGFGDIWRGLVCGQSVCVKIVRLFEDSDIQALLNAFGREALVWRQLCHPNVLPFFGLYYLEGRLCLVSPWMERGNIIQYFKKEEPHIGRRVLLIMDVALGLEYLHSQHIIHGDLKAINVLVTPSHRACICDFGLSSIADVTLQLTQSTTSTTQQGTERYCAPELLRPIGPSRKDFASDVYAFACVCYEILTEKVPFHEEQNNMAVLLRVLEGARPSQPVSCMDSPYLDNLWQLIESCWQQKPQDRPTAVQIVQRLQGPLIQATTTLSTSDWDETFTSRFRRASQPQPLLPSVTQIERMLFGDGRFNFWHDITVTDSDFTIAADVAEGAPTISLLERGYSPVTDTACKECFPDDEPTEKTSAHQVYQSRSQTKRGHEKDSGQDADFEDDLLPDSNQLQKVEIG